MSVYKIEELNYIQSSSDLVDYAIDDVMKVSQHTASASNTSKRAGQRRLRTESFPHKTLLCKGNPVKPKLDREAFRKYLTQQGLAQYIIDKVLNGPGSLAYTISLASHDQTLMEVACYMLARDVDIEERGDRGHTPLLMALNLDESKFISIIINHLIANEADFKSINNQTGDSSLHYAASNGNLDMVTLALLRGVDPKIENLKNDTVLHSAARASKNGPEIINLLHKKGVDINNPNSLGETPLYIAASQGNLKSVKTLVELGAKFNTKPSPLEIAIINNRHDVVKYLIERGAI